MRYHWGLGVGHTYSHKDATAANLRILGTHRPYQGVLGTDLSVEQAHSRDAVPKPNAEEDGDANASRAGEPEGDGELGGEGSEDEGHEDVEEEDHWDDDDDDDDDFRDPGYDSEAEKEYALFGRYS